MTCRFYFFITFFFVVVDLKMKMENSFFVSAKDDEEVVVDHQWDGYTLLLPCVSVGNVPQLACDLLVSSLLKKTSSSSSDQSDPKDLELVGYIRSSSVRPFAGPDPYSLHGPLLATSIQGLGFFFVYPSSSFYCLVQTLNAMFTLSLLFFFFFFFLNSLRLKGKEARPHSAEIAHI